MVQSRFIRQLMPSPSPPKVWHQLPAEPALASETSQTEKRSVRFDPPLDCIPKYAPLPRSKPN